MRWIRYRRLCLALLILVGTSFALAAESDSTAADEQILKAARVGTDGPALLELFRKRTITDAVREKIQGLIRQLGDDSFEVREKATAALIDAGSPALPALRVAARDADLEISRRAQECLRQIVEKGTATALPAAAARLLAVRKPAGATEVVVPIKIQQEVIGLLVVVRKQDKAFERGMLTLLEAVADYASISLVNARLFRALQEAAQVAQAGESRKREQLQGMRQEIQSQLQPLLEPVDFLLAGKMGMLNQQQQEALKNVKTVLLRILQTVTTDLPSQPVPQPRHNSIWLGCSWPLSRES